MGAHRRSIVGLLLPLTVLFAPIHAAVQPYISTFSEIRTECKTCPHVLCPNQAVIEYGDPVNVTAWTRGTKIAGDRTWLRTQAGCYVTQYDIRNYTGNWETDLEYAGRDSEEEHITTQDARLQYKTECRICVDILCDVVAYLPEETDVTLTCWTDGGQVIIDDPYWLKTTNNCYVAEKGLYSVPDKTSLDNCGPIPFLEYIDHNNPPNVTSEVDKRDPLPVPVDQSAHYLINVTVGEDYAYCRSCPQESCDVQTRYPFNSEVWLQCLVKSTNETWWSETTDFCYVKNSDFWQSPEGDFYANPLCSDFVDPGNS